MRKAFFVAMALGALVAGALVCVFCMIDDEDEEEFEHECMGY